MVSVSLALSAVLLTQPTVRPDTIRPAAERSLVLLRKAVNGHMDQRECFGCHNQAFPMAAFAAARDRKFDVPSDDTDKLFEHLTDFVETNRERYEKGEGTGGGADTAGYILFTLAEGKRSADDNSAAVVKYLLKAHAERDYWRCTSDRPPSEASHFTTTYLAVRGLKAFGSKDQAEAIEKRVTAARKWLDETKPKDTEDQVFQLLGLHAAGAESDAVRASADRLLKLQRADGGFAQRDQDVTDAYATGTALYALHTTGTLAPDSLRYRAGVAFLLRKQSGDGSWHVPTRSKPFQKYYESGFPHGKDQFISVTASAWATAAMMFTLPK
jgi:hypothetical protein